MRVTGTYGKDGPSFGRPATLSQAKARTFLCKPPINPLHYCNMPTILAEEIDDMTLERMREWARDLPNNNSL